MAVTKSQEATKAALDALNAIANGGNLVIFSGTVPANADAAQTGAVLATLPLQATAYGAATTASPSVSTINTPVTGTVSGTGSPDPTYYRIQSSGGTVVHQGSVPADLSFDDNTAWENGATVTVTSQTVTLSV